MDWQVIFQIYYIAMVIFAVYFFIMASANVLGMKICTSKPKIINGPLVSVLVPARNEEKNIENCISRLVKQDYQNYEILVIDDFSNDKTNEIIMRIAGQNSRVRAFTGKPLPENWNGKAFALEQLVPHAKGEILLFTDADTIHSPTSISWAITNLQNTGADFISGYVGQILKTFGEQVTVPLIFFLTGFLIPIFLSKIVRLGYFSLAIGQYIVVKKNVYLSAGGFTAVKTKTSEDVYLARHIKKCGYKTEFLDITDQVFCRMYTGYGEGIRGIGKNIYDFFNKIPILLILNAVAIFLFFCLPFPVLVYSLLSGNPAGNPFMIHLITVHILFTLTWLIMFIGRRINWLNAFCWPVMYFNLLFMVLWSFYRSVTGRGFIWKNRVVK